MHPLEEYRLRNKLTQKDLAKIIEVDTGNLSKIIKGKVGVSADVAYRIREKLNIELPLTAREEKMLDKAVDKMFTTDTEPIAANFNTHKPNMYKVPLKAWGGFMAGYESKVFDDNIEKVYFPLVKGECYAFEIDGYSMLPDYKPNDYFVGKRINGFDWLVKGRDYIFQTVDGLILKRFVSLDDKQCVVESVNPDYNPVKPIPLKEIKALYQREGVWAI